MTIVTITDILNGCLDEIPGATGVFWPDTNFHECIDHLRSAWWQSLAIDCCGEPGVVLFTEDFRCGLCAEGVMLDTPVGFDSERSN